VLPFPDIVSANAVAVDTAGNLYVTEEDNHQYSADNRPKVWQLAAGASAPTLLPFPDLREPQGVAIDMSGNLYVTDGNDNRVWKLAAGASNPILLPFNDLKNPAGVAVDNAGNVYVADRNTKRVLKLAAGANSATPLSLPEFGRLDAVAVDSSGNLYVTDAHDPCTRSGPCAFLDETGRVEDGRVLKFPKDSTVPTVLPFTGLDYSRGLAVDAAENVYVVDGTDRVLELPVQETP
jgi:serine/threonine-protein kinase